MPTKAQLEANRRNAQKSTGPRTPEGKAVARFNALKTGISAQAEVIPSESPEDLEALISQFYGQFHPAAPDECGLLDIVIRNEWLLRRMAVVEAHYWALKQKRNNEIAPLDDRDVIGPDLTRLQWRINSIQRNLFSAMDRLGSLQQSRQATDPGPLTPELASFGNPIRVSIAPEDPAGLHLHPRVPIDLPRTFQPEGTIGFRIEMPPDDFTRPHSYGFARGGRPRSL